MDLWGFLSVAYDVGSLQGVDSSIVPPESFISLKFTRKPSQPKGKYGKPDGLEIAGAFHLQNNRWYPEQ